MKLIVGLGNPGKQYEHTRHNMGFDVLDILADSFGENIDREAFKANYLKVKYFDEDLLLVKPLTYMNLSGESVIQFVNYFKIEPQDIYIVHDDMDIPVGNIKLKERGRSAGHNGLKSIIQHLGTQEFKRIKVGIGKPQFNSIDFVLSKPSKEESELIDKAKKTAAEAIKYALKENFDKAMTKYNSEVSTDVNQ